MVKLVDVPVRPGHFGFAHLETKPARTGNLFAFERKMARCLDGKNRRWRPNHHGEIGTHQLPIYVRVGSKVELGDLQKEWTESVAIANTRPDLKSLDAEVRQWFDKHYPDRTTAAGKP